MALESLQMAIELFVNYPWVSKQGFESCAPMRQCSTEVKHRVFLHTELEMSKTWIAGEMELSWEEDWDGRRLGF